MLTEIGRRARDFTQRCVGGKAVELRFDILNTTSDNLDRYGRTLAYVKFYCKKPPAELQTFWKKLGVKKKWKKRWISLNSLLIQCGHAMVDTRNHFKYRDKFAGFEKQARDAKIGMWGPIELPDRIPSEAVETKASSTPREQEPFVGATQDPYYHFNHCTVLESILPHNRVYFSERSDAEKAGRVACPLCNERTQ